jgi:hypothetical protein
MSASGTNENKGNRNGNSNATPAWRDARGAWHPYEGSLKDVRIPRGARVVGPPDIGPGTGPFTARKTIRSVSVPEGATELSFRVFWNCSSLERAELPRSLAKIGGDAFLGTALREIVYAGSVEEFERIEIVGWDALGGCSPVIRCWDAAIDFSRKPFWVKELSFPGTMAEWKSRYRSRGKRLHWLRRQVGVVHCSDGDLRGEPEPGVLALPEGTGHVPFDPLADRSGVKTVCLPASVTTIAGFLGVSEAPFPAHAFEPFTRLREILVDPDSATFESRDGVLYTKGGGTLLYAPDPQRRTFRVPDGTSKIDPFAFDACPRLEAFEVSPDHPAFSVVDGVLFSRDGRTLVRVPPAWRGALSFGEDREPVRVAPGAFRDCHGLSGLSFARLPVPTEVDPEAGPEDFSWWFDGLVDELSRLPGLRTFAVGGGTFDLDAKPPRLRRLEALKTPKSILDKERSLWAAARRARACRLGPPPANRG